MPKRPLSSLQSVLKKLLQPFELRSGPLAISAGLRTLVFVGGPIGVGILTGQSAVSAIAVLSALFVGMVDVGGAYRQKATAMMAATAGMTLMLLVANLVSGSPGLVAVTTFWVMFAVGLSGLFGKMAATVSLSTSLIYIVALAKFAAFPTLSDVLEQALLCFAGGLWAVVVSLSIWIQSPYLPAMRSVAACYAALGKFVETGRERTSGPLDLKDWAKRFLQGQDSVTQTIADARGVLSAIWTEGRAANLRGNQLIVLTENASQSINSVLALVEQLSISSNHVIIEPFLVVIQEVQEKLATSFDQVAVSLMKPKRSIHLQDLDRALEDLIHQQKVLRTRLKEGDIIAQAHDFEALVSVGKIITILQALAEKAHQGAQVVQDLHQGKEGSLLKLELYRPIQSRRSALDVLRDNMTFDSTLFRHALRLALVTTLAELIASLGHVPNGYWITITAVVALKPDFGSTTQTTVQRVLGTTLGGLIGIAIVVLVHQPLLIGICLLGLLVAAIAVRPLSYSLFILLLTPVVVLLLNVTGKGGWEIGLVRAVDSLAGGALALLGSYLLFPSWEKFQVGKQLRTTVNANLAYFQAVAGIYTAESDLPANALRHAYQQAAVENANAATAVQRRLGEPRHVQGKVEPTTTALFYIRRFFNSVTTLAEHYAELSEQYQCSEFNQFTEAVIEILKNLADSLRLGQSPGALPELEGYLRGVREHVEQLHVARIEEISHSEVLESPLRQTVRDHTPIATEMARIAEEITGLHAAVSRLHQAEDREIDVRSFSAA